MEDEVAKSAMQDSLETRTQRLQSSSKNTQIEVLRGLLTQLENDG